MPKFVVNVRTYVNNVEYWTRYDNVNHTFTDYDTAAEAYNAVKNEYPIDDIDVLSRYEYQTGVSGWEETA